MAEHNDAGVALFFYLSPHAAFDEFDVVGLFYLGCVAIDDGVLDLVGTGFERDIADAELEILIGDGGINGNDVRKGAHGHAVVIGELLAIEFLSGETVSPGIEAKDPEVVGAEGLDELIDIAVESVDGR